MGVGCLHSCDSPSPRVRVVGRCCVVGLFLSVLRGLLSELDLNILRDAYFGVYWQPLSTIVREYAAFVASNNADPVSAEDLAAAYAWRPAAPVIRDELARDSALIRKVLNGKASPPAAAAPKPCALLWFYPRGPFHKVGRSLPSWFLSWAVWVLALPAWRLCPAGRRHSPLLCCASGVIFTL